MRACKNCSTEDPESFYQTQKAHYCRPCFNLRYVAPGRERLLQAKLGRGECVDCHLKVTEENACVMDWDHLGDKKFNVSTMTSCSLASFNREIAKCELRCSNCHRLKTKERGRHWKTGGRPRGSRPRPLNSPSPTQTPPDAT